MFYNGIVLKTYFFFYSFHGNRIYILVILKNSYEYQLPGKDQEPQAE
jgi:hypothetical protein